MTTILGCDARPATLDAIALAARLDPDPDSRVIVATAVPPRLWGEEVPPEARRAGEGVLDDAARRLAGRRVEQRVLRGRSPAHALGALAEEEQADLIVLGSSHQTDRGRVHAGSVGRGLLAGAPCPVAVAPAAYAADPPAPLTAIGVAWDEGDDARAALAYARTLAPEPARVSLIHVLDVELASALWGYEGYAYALAALPEDGRDEARARLDRAAASAGVSSELREGSPSGELIDASEHLDLLVLGSRGYGPVLRVALGSVSARVLRDAGCPVVVVPRGTVDPDADAGPRRSEQTAQG